MAEKLRTDPYGIGVVDGDLRIYPMSELPRLVAERDAMLAEADDDDLSDLSEIEALFGSKKKTDAEDAFNESDHPRGQPGNAGQFGSGGGGSKKSDGGDFKTYATSDDLRPLTDAVQSGDLNDGLGDTKEKRLALGEYSGSATSWDINRALREGGDLDVNQEAMLGEAGETVNLQQAVDTLDKAMKGSSLSENLSVWRALAYKGDESPEVKKMIDGLKPGDTFIDKGFVSTSAIKHRPAGEVLKILAPKGSKALIVNGTFIGYDGENEVILDRGGSYEYLGDEDGTKVFRLKQGGGLAQDAAEWNEGEHPRAPDGRFGEKAGEHGGVAAPKPRKITDKRGQKIDAPTKFYRGDNPGSTQRIKTGDDYWDSKLFITSDPDDAKSYGNRISSFEADPSAKILYESTPEFSRLAKGLHGSLLDTSSEIAKRAEKEGYDAVWFRRQGDIGTVVLNKDKFRAMRSGYEPGVQAKGFDAAVALRKNVWQKEGPDSVEAIVAAAPKNQAKLAEVCEAVAGKTGLKFKNPGPKKEARIVLKLGRGKTPREVNDAVRGGFDVQTPDQADEIVKALAENFEVADEGWSTTPTGYFDRKVMVRFDDGMVGEIQVWPPGLLEIKSSKGHELYTEWQRAPSGPKKAALMKAQVALYAAAFGAMPHVWSQVVSAPSM